MYFINRITLTVFVCLLALVASKPTCLQASESVDVYKTITLHAERAQFKKTVELLANYEWSEKTNPLVVIFYCNALFERQVSVADADRLFIRMPRHVQQFAKVMVRLFYGKVIEAKVLLGKFNWTIYDSWQQIAELEIALYTGNYKSMAPFLRLLRTQAHKYSSMEAIHGFYSVVYHFKMGKYEGARNLLNRIDLRGDLNLLRYRIELLARNDDFESADYLLSDTKRKYGAIRTGVIYKGWLTELQYGPQKAANFYAEANQKHPTFFNVAWLRAVYLFDYNTPSFDFEGVTRIKKILLEKRPFDVYLKLDSVNTFLSIGSKFEAVDFLNRAKGQADIDQFLLYELIAARIYDDKAIYAKNKKLINESTKLRDKYLASVLNKSPYHLEALWLKFTILREAKRTNQAILVLKDILYADPGNLQALIELVKLYLLVDEGDSKIKPLILSFLATALAV